MKRLFTPIIALFVCMISLQSMAVTHVISQSGFSFSPIGLSCNVGDVIRWEWSAGSHTTTSASVPQGAATWDSDLDAGTPSFEYTVEVAGTYTYFCALHVQSNMVGAFQADAPASIKTVVNSNRDMTVGLEMGSKTMHIHLDGGDAISGAIRIYDITGKVAATVFEGNFGSEEKLYQYDGSNLGRGIYFVRFETGAKVITRKIMLN